MYQSYTNNDYLQSTAIEIIRGTNDNDNNNSSYINDNKHITAITTMIISTYVYNIYICTCIYGCFLKWWYPQSPPQVLIICSRKTHGFVGFSHHFRKPPYIYIHSIYIYPYIYTQYIYIYIYFSPLMFINLITLIWVKYWPPICLPGETSKTQALFRDLPGISGSKVWFIDGAGQPTPLP